jgi:hypothetical protein
MRMKEIFTEENIPKIYLFIAVALVSLLLVYLFSGNKIDDVQESVEVDSKKTEIMKKLDAVNLEVNLSDEEWTERELLLERMSLTEGAVEQKGTVNLKIISP